MQKHKSDIKDMMELMKQGEGDTGSPAVQSEYVCLWLCLPCGYVAVCGDHYLLVFRSTVCMYTCMC